MTLTSDSWHVTHDARRMSILQEGPMCLESLALWIALSMGMLSGAY